MVNGAHMGPIWGRQDPGGPHVGPVNFAIWEDEHRHIYYSYFAVRAKMQNGLYKSSFCFRVMLYHRSLADVKCGDVDVEKLGTMCKFTEIWKRGDWSTQP